MSEETRLCAFKFEQIIIIFQDGLETNKIDTSVLFTVLGIPEW